MDREDIFFFGVFLLVVSGIYWATSVQPAPLSGKAEKHSRPVKRRDGVIGVRTDWGKYRKIGRIHPSSPADVWGLAVGDQILDVDGKGHKQEINGEPYTYVKVTVRRGDVIIEFNIMRVPRKDLPPYGHEPIDFGLGVTT